VPQLFGFNCDEKLLNMFSEGQVSCLECEVRSASIYTGLEIQEVSFCSTKFSGNLKFEA